MSEKIIKEKTIHQEPDEAEIRRTETRVELQDEDGGVEETVTQTVAITETERRKRNFPAWVIAFGIIAAVALLSLFWIWSKQSAAKETSVSVSAEKDEHGGGGKDEHKEGETGREVKLDPEMLESGKIETETVTQRPAISKLYVTGSVELNPEKTEMATPLVGGRIENVYFGVGDNVRQGAVLAVISSPQLAQMHGKMHEARTRYELAQRNFARVQKTENRVAVLQAKAKLDEAEATLKRTRRLIELGAGAGKDLISAETNFKTAKADYDFQSNISLNKEIQEARAEVETAQVDLRHIQDEMRSLGVNISINEPDDHSKDTSLVAVRAPLSGIITERKFNAGAGIDAATPIFAISNLSTVYVIANVPESSVGKLSVSSIAEIKSPSIGAINGRISYIDPRLDETTRTARVRLEVPNGSGKLRAGMFADVGFYAGTSEGGGQELVVKTEAVQRIGERTIVFVPREKEPGAYEVREIEIGGEIEGYTQVKSGLELGEQVVTKGSFILKTQMQKGELGDDDH